MAYLDKMLLPHLLLIFLPALAYGRIDIRINADTNPALANVEYMGEDVAIISDQ